MTFLRSTRSFLAPKAGLLEHPDDLMAGAPGEGTEITFLARTRLIIGADPAVDGDLSQLNPLENRPAEVLQLRRFELRSSVSNRRLPPGSQSHRALVARTGPQRLAPPAFESVSALDEVRWNLSY